MNGAPYYSPPHKHQKSYASRLGSLAEQALKPELAELPALVASAIRRGLIKRPDPSGLVPTPILKRGPLAEWQTTQCDECGVTFERHKRTLTKCKACRSLLLKCGSCGKQFRSSAKKKVGCSAECSQKMQVQNYRTQVACCVVCQEKMPAIRRGSAVAKTCSAQCSATYRKTRNARFYQSHKTKKNK
jgi:hypothetical protein